MPASGALMILLGIALFGWLLPGGRARSIADYATEQIPGTPVPLQPQGKTPGRQPGEPITRDGTKYQPDVGQPDNYTTVTPADVALRGFYEPVLGVEVPAVFLPQNPWWMTHREKLQSYTPGRP